MPVSTKTKAVAGLAALDIVRQVVTAWAAREKAERDRIGFGQGIARDARQLARDARGHMPDLSRWELERGWPPLHHRSSAAERARAWWPIAAILVLTSAAVAFLAHRIASETRDETEPDPKATDSRMVGAVRAGSKAIDAGVMKVVDGGSSAATGTVAAVAAGSSAIRTATVDRAKVELEERVVEPAKKKAIVYGALGFTALTIYVIVIAVVVQLLVGAIG